MPISLELTTTFIVPHLPEKGYIAVLKKVRYKLVIGNLYSSRSHGWP